MIVEHRDFFNDGMFKTLLESFEYSLDSIVITSLSPQEHFLYVNQAFKLKTGYTESELVGKSPRILQGPKTNRKILDELKSKLKSNEHFRGQNVNYKKDGSEYIVKWQVSALKNDNKETIAYISFQKELTQSIWEHKKIHFLAAAINQVDQMVVVTDLKGIIVYVNDAFSRGTGFSKEFALNRSIDFLSSKKHSKSFYSDLWQTLLENRSYHGTFINKRKNGEIYFEQKTITPIVNEDGEVEFFVSIAQDITSIINQSDEYKNKAYTDVLTGLYNRLKYDEVMQRKYKEFLNNQKIFTLILIDIDNFKYINDTFGHDAGDEVLKELANILKKTLRNNDFITRWGGEEFAVVIDNNIMFSTILANRLRESVESKLAIKEHSITVSLGVSQIYKQDSLETFFNRTDKALYRSKQSGKNKVTALNKHLQEIKI